MALTDDLERIATLAAAHGPVSGVLAAEPGRGRRLYLIAFGGDDDREWLVLDDEGAPITRRDDVRDTASIVAMCELAGDLAGGGDLETLRSQLARVRMVEQPPGIEEAGAATMTLERALGETSSPFSAAIRASTGAVEEFVADVERGYKAPLS